MKAKLQLGALLLSVIANQVAAAPDDMTVTAYDPGCEHTMTTNHFELAAGQSVEIDLDLTACYQEQIGGLMYYGYHTSKSRSKPLVERDNVRLILVDGDGNELVSDNGSIYTEPTGPEMCKLYAQNLHPKKSITIRLRAKAGL
jgi:hypothetical protein